MASPIPGHLSSQPPTPGLRLPKLAYRNRLGDADSVNTEGTDTSRTSVSTNPTSPLHSNFCPSPRDPPADMLSAPPSMAPRTPNKPPKKRPNFFSGLFGAKEPSTQAFAEYQKHVLRQAHGRTTNAGLPGVSSAKLPPTVPKVNSRWDGVPQQLKEKGKLQQESRLSMGGHSQNTSNTRSAGSDRRSGSRRRQSVGTLGGTSTHTNSSNKLSELYGWEVKSHSSSSSAIVDFASEHRPTSSCLQTSHNAPPPLERTSLFPPCDPPLPPTSSHPYFQRSPPSSTSSPNPPSHSNSPAHTPYESSPITPNAPSPMFNLTSSLVSRPQDGLKTTVVEAPESVDEVIIRSAGVDILGPPATAKRRPKPSPYLSGRDRPSTSGVDMQLSSILKKQSAKDTPSPRPALASYFPSPGSVSPAAPVRRNSARERLGLGMSLKNQAVAPWCSSDQAAESLQEGERIITPTPDEGGQSLRRKSRMSLFHK